MMARQAEAVSSHANANLVLAYTHTIQIDYWTVAETAQNNFQSNNSLMLLAVIEWEEFDFII